MAREQRKDVDYFPHDCIHGRKMHIIETKYGNDGYATWFKLLEQLGKANNHYIDFSDEMTFMFLTSVFKIDEERTLNILTDLAKLDAIDKELFDNHKIIWSEKFCKSIEDAYRKRKQKMFFKEDILQLKNSISSGNPSIPGGMNTKTDENNEKEVIPAEVIHKEEYSKVKEIISKSHCDFYKSQNDEIEKVQSVNSEEKSKRKKVPPKKEKELDHWKSIVDMWFNFYKSKFAISPTFNATEGKHLKNIVTKFQTLAKEKDKNESVIHVWTEDRVLRMFEKFLNQAWIDKWLSENFLLKNLNSNFDSIITKKNNQNGIQQQSISGTGKKQFDFNPERIIETHISKT